MWEVIKNEDWVLTAGTLEDWTLKLWDFDKPYRHPGKSLGTATQIGISLGVALAHRDAGRLVVDIQPDGDLMFDAGALWVAVKHKIPMLVVMYNNRSYYNDWEHQIRMAKLRGTPVERAHIGMDLEGPDRGFRRARALDGLVRGRPDRARQGRRPRAEARDRQGQGRPARAARHHHPETIGRQISATITGPMVESQTWSTFKHDDCEQNEYLTRTGPGTPMGALFRRYWLPALLAEELPEPDCAPVRVKLLGERLVAFRDTSGRLGLVSEFCAHRGVSLWFGRNEENGLRCPYHGWKYDVTGQCVDVPSEPAGNGFCEPHQADELSPDRARRRAVGLSRGAGAEAAGARATTGRASRPPSVTSRSACRNATGSRRWKERSTRSTRAFSTATRSATIRS